MKQYKNIMIWSERHNVARYYLWITCIISIPLFYEDFRHTFHYTKYFYLVITIFTLPLCIFYKKIPELLITYAALLVTILYFLIRTFTQMHSPEHMLWIPVFPVIYFFLTDQRWGIFLSVSSFGLLLLSYLFFKKFTGYESVSHTIFIQAVIAYFLTGFISYYFEKDWKLTQSKLIELSEIDFLTNILNRRGIERRFRELSDNADRYNEHLSIIQFDLDKFKSINDMHGHQKGDQILKEISEFIKKRIRKTDVFGRLGGEEFLLIIRHSSVSTAKKQAEKLRKDIQKNKFNDLQITVSFGVTEYLKGESIDKTISRADRAMYRSKIKRNEVTAL